MSKKSCPIKNIKSSFTKTYLTLGTSYRYFGSEPGCSYNRMVRPKLDPDPTKIPGSGIRPGYILYRTFKGCTYDNRPTTKNQSRFLGDVYVCKTFSISYL